jgi:hypothetical protein
MKTGDIIILTIDGVFNGIVVVKKPIDSATKKEWQVNHPGEPLKSYRDWLYENGYVDFPVITEFSL